MAKLTLNNVGSLIDATTAQTTINNNSDAIEAAMENTFSRDGTEPNQMETTLDMNSHQILNLPTPLSANSALRLQDLVDFNGGGTISTIPPGGTTGQTLAKVDDHDYHVEWSTAGQGTVQSVGLTTPSDFTVTGSPVTISGDLALTWATTPTGTGPIVRQASPDITGTSPNLTAGTVTTNANLTGPITSVGNVTSAAAQTGTGSTFVMQDSPALTTPSLGTPASGTLTNCTGYPTTSLTAITDYALIGNNTGSNASPTAIQIASLTTKATPAAGDYVLLSDQAAAGAFKKATVSSFSSSSGVSSIDALTGAFTTSDGISSSGNDIHLTVGQIPGTATNDSASAGNVGEYVESVITSGSAVSLVSATPKNVTSISLTAGDWDVDATISYFPANTTQFSALQTSISLVSNTADITPGRLSNPPQATITANGSQVYTTPIPPYRFSLSATTTIYVIANASFTVSTTTAFGILRARRIR